MKLTIYSLKGSAGKTPIAVNIALDKDYALGTNEPYHVLDSLLPEERLISLEPHEAFPALPPDIDIVFDLAWTISRGARASILSAIQQSDAVLVPIYNELKCLNAGVNTIRELQSHTDRIVIVATKLQRQKGESFTDRRESADFQNIARIANGALGVEFPVFPLKYSKAFDAIFEQERSIAQIMARDPLLNYAWRETQAQFEALFNYLIKTYAHQKRSVGL